MPRPKRRKNLEHVKTPSIPARFWLVAVQFELKILMRNNAKTKPIQTNTSDH